MRDQRWYDSYRDELFSSSSNLGSSGHAHGNQRHQNTLNSETSSADKNDEEKKKKNCQFSFGTSLQYWTDKNGETIKFMKITGMYSELIGVSVDGRLHQWKWSSEVPFALSINVEGQLESGSGRGQITVYHPKTLFLQLLNEKVCGVASSTVRASCWTESGKVGSFVCNLIDSNENIKFIF